MHKLRFLCALPLFAPADETGGASPPAGAGDPPPGSQQPGGGQPPADAPAPPSAYRPEGLPDHLFGASDKETIDYLYKAFDGYRKGAAERGEVPKDAAGYAFEPSEAVKPYMTGDLTKDPVMTFARQAAQKAGLTDKQFAAFVGPMLEAMVSGGMMEDPFDPAAEQAL